MTLKELIDPNLFPLKKTDTVEFALEMLLEKELSVLPVVEDQVVIGFVKGKDLINVKVDESIEPYLSAEPNAIKKENLHYTQALWFFKDASFNCFAILDQDGLFSGIVSRKKLLNFLTESYSFKAEGSVIWLEIHAQNYSLNTLSNIVENNDAKIIGLTLFSIPDSSHIIVSLKINTPFSESIVSSLRRFGFDIRGVFYNQSSESDLEHRYNSLLKYLEF
ncbi:MAG: CBS domain-containing protein [Flavobacteriales bacterium]|nr:CBS domain-containing protein [Flavobacteriales bacterium]